MYDAILLKASWSFHDDGARLHGFVHGDKKGRFADGDYIHTTPVLSHEGHIFHTKNTRYLVVLA